jgi:hypothetical protein
VHFAAAEVEIDAIVRREAAESLGDPAKFKDRRLVDVRPESSSTPFGNSVDRVPNVAWLGGRVRHVRIVSAARAEHIRITTSAAAGNYGGADDV